MDDSRSVTGCVVIRTCPTLNVVCLCPVSCVCARARVCACVSLSPAGRGIVHAEMPAGDEPTLGLQLWVNLRGKDKMVEPEYQELSAADIPSPSKDGVTVNIIAGKSMGLESPVFTKTPTAYLDIIMEGGKEFQQAVPAGWNSFAFIISGSGTFGPDDAAMESAHSHTLVFSNDGSEDGVKVKAGPDGCRFVLISGEPLKEPVMQHGPFVMQTR